MFCVSVFLRCDASRLVVTSSTLVTIPSSFVFILFSRLSLQSHVSLQLSCSSFSHSLFVRFKHPLKLFFCHTWQILWFFYGYYHMIELWSEWPQNLWHYRFWCQYFSTRLDLIRQFCYCDEKISHTFIIFHLK